MHDVTGSRLMLFLMTIMVATILLFVLFEQDSSRWINEITAELTKPSVSIWLISLFIIVVLGADVIFPVPSSLVAVFAATTLGFFTGALVIWLGLMLGVCFGYLLGLASSRFARQGKPVKKQVTKAHGLTNKLTGKLAASVLITLRGVPVLAETSVIAAGLVRYPLAPFILITALANAGLALAYGYIGSRESVANSFLLIIGSSIAIPFTAWLLKQIWEYWVQHHSHDVTNNEIERKATKKSVITKPYENGVMTEAVNEIKKISAEFQLPFSYPVIFENDVFAPKNPVLHQLLNPSKTGKQRVFVYIDAGLAQAHKPLSGKIEQYFRHFADHLTLIAPPHTITGGEAAKQAQHIQLIYQQLLTFQLDRHACVLVIGGGAVLDAVGFACSTFHRGIKLLRMPSTVLAQNDAGVGVKNGFNLFQCKNLIGCFSPPLAVLNDASLLQTLSVRDRRAGLAEAVKVAAIRDADFFHWLEENMTRLNRFEHYFKSAKKSEPFQSNDDKQGSAGNGGDVENDGNQSSAGNGGDVENDGKQGSAGNGGDVENDGNQGSAGNGGDVENDGNQGSAGNGGDVEVEANQRACRYAIARCAQLHLAQITQGGDPFESGSARPLDYGHWSAHKLESLADYNIRHGEAVAIGMALDARYAVNVGLLDEIQAMRLIHLLEGLGFKLWHQALEHKSSNGDLLIFNGLEEFRQHLGGQLCITLLTDIGIAQDISVIDTGLLLDALLWLKERLKENVLRQKQESVGTARISSVDQR